LALVSFPFSASASNTGENNAEQACTSKIKNVYGINKFRNVWADRLGHHKFKVHGQVKVRDHFYEFNCKTKNGEVVSFAYDGPHGRHKNDDDLATAVAVAAGLAIVAGIAASQDDDKGHDRDRGSLPSQTVLEDECHDMLQYRIRDEHDYTARVNIREAKLKGRDLTGDAKVNYDRGHPHQALFTCHFDNRGRLMDSSYRLH
jgi:hypothetical protein